MLKLSQRNLVWSFKTIGKSSSTIGALGCTITCISMASYWFGCYKDPAWMAKNLRFLKDLIIWQSIGEKLCFGFEWRFYKYDEKRILDGLKDPNKVCLLQVYGRHWVLAAKKIPFIGYLTIDPWIGGYKTYSISSISGGAILRK